VDAADPAAFASFLRTENPGAVVHLAAHPDPDFCEDHPEEARRLNLGSVQTLAATVPAGTYLLFVSSDYVFDGRLPPYAEDAPRSPLSLYGRLKCEAEDILARRPNTAILRVPLLIGGGPDLERSGFISIMRRALKGGEPQTVDDVLVRRPIWTRDVAEVIAFLLRTRATGVLQASGPRGGTRYGWTCEFARIFGLPCAHLKPSREVVARRAGRPRDSHLLTARLDALGAPAPRDFAEVVRVVMRELGG
jgi:dTDP-4-dehydrorhamnose reductase